MTAEFERIERREQRRIGLIRYAIAVSSLTFILWYNASDFDVTEYKTIALMMAILGGTEMLPTNLKRILGHAEDSGSSG